MPNIRMPTDLLAVSNYKVVDYSPTEHRVLRQAVLCTSFVVLDIAIVGADIANASIPNCYILQNALAF